MCIMSILYGFMMNLQNDRLPVLLTRLIGRYTFVTTALVIAFITATIDPIYLSNEEVTKTNGLRRNFLSIFPTINAKHNFTVASETHSK